MNTIVLIIIIIFVAFLGFIVFGIIGGTLKESSSEIATSCIKLDLKVESCSIENGIYKVQIKRGADELNLSEIVFIFSNGEESESVNRDASILEPLETKVFNIENINADTVDIAAVLTLSEGIRVCPAVNSPKECK